MVEIPKKDQGIIRKILKAGKVKNFSDGAAQGRKAAKGKKSGNGNGNGKGKKK